MLNGANVFLEAHGRELEAHWQRQEHYDKGKKLIEGIRDQLMGIWVAERNCLITGDYYGLKLEPLHQDHGEEGREVIESFTFMVGHEQRNKGKTQRIGKLTLLRSDGGNPYPAIALEVDGEIVIAHTFEGHLASHAAAAELADLMRAMIRKIPGLFGMKALPEVPAEKTDWNTRAAEFYDGMQAVVASFNKANTDEQTGVRMQIEPISGKEPFCAQVYSLMISRGGGYAEEITVFGAMMHGAIGFQTKPGGPNIYRYVKPVTKYVRDERGIFTTSQMESLWRDVAKAFHPLMRSRGFRQQGRDMPLVYGY